MAQIVKAAAFANNEVAFIAWTTDIKVIPGCLGFQIVREYLDFAGQVSEERALASYIAFRGQRNPTGQPQNTSIWPVQKFTWRDLTLRRRRNALALRPEDETVRYRIRAVGNFKAGMEEVVPISESHWDAGTQSEVIHSYEGAPRRMGYLTPPAWTNSVVVTRRHGPFLSTFTNGVLSTQFLVRVLKEDGVIEPGELREHLETPGDKIRDYLAGDVLTTITEFFARPGGRFYAALYELEDQQLIAMLAANASRLDLILSDAGSRDIKDPVTKKKIGTEYDTRNDPARTTLSAIAAQPGSSFRLQHRLFNGSGHIGHNKFVVHVDDQGVARSVLTGSTNWTWSGVAGQSNNLIQIDDDAIAATFLDYWQRLHADPLPVPHPTTTKNTGANQSAAFKQANRTPALIALDNGASAECWFSPNMPGKQQPPARSVTPPPAPPPDMARLFELIRKAEKMILFAVFLPSRGGLNSIVEAAIDMGLKDGNLAVLGAISDSQAMWSYRPSETTATGATLPAWAPHSFRRGNVDVVRATALTDREIGRQIGDFSNEETLTLGKAIIHDKILVIDPLDPVNCTVAFGSHNMGYKASYSNDENLVIVRGHSGLAQAYAIHVLDLFDHYRFRAVEAERAADANAAGTAVPASGGSKGWDGFLDTKADWQAKANRRLAGLFTS